MKLITSSQEETRSLGIASTYPPTLLQDPFVGYSLIAELGNTVTKRFWRARCVPHRPLVGGPLLPSRSADVPAGTAVVGGVVSENPITLVTRDSVQSIDPRGYRHPDATAASQRPAMGLRLPRLATGPRVAPPSLSPRGIQGSRAPRPAP